MVSLTAVSSFEMIPEIVTDRLRLRPHGMQDFAASAAMWADPEVTRFIGGRPFSEEETWARLLRYAGHWSFLGFGYWAVEEHSGSDFIGEVGFADFKRQIQPPIGDIPELGWLFVPRVSRKRLCHGSSPGCVGVGQNQSVITMDCFSDPS
jgi:RimJ/RimL family protein N-acetyltransferase